MRLGCAVLLTLGAGTACGGGTPGAHGATGGAAVVRVPQDVRTVQAAVDRVRPGGLVLVSPGVYRESVTVAKPRVVLRGTDRTKVVVDGEFERANGITVTGAGSVVENLTVRNNLANGVLFTGVTDKNLQGAGRAGGSAYDPLDTVKFPPLHGFRASYITAYNNALYGIYAFDARSGVIERSYASGQADSGIYVGQCRPCATVVRDNVTEHNAVGIELTNASERLWVVGNRVTRNRVGLTVNSNDLEALGPQHDAVVAGNAITDNNDDRGPEQADGGFGIGIGAGGARDNLFTRNLVSGNRAAGVVVTDVQGYPASGNSVRGNRISGNGADAVLSVSAVRGNRFAGNGGSAGAVQPRVRAVAQPPGVSFQEVSPPAAQVGMPGDVAGPGRGAVGLPGPVDLEGYPLPSSAGAVPRGRR
ncbi:hypothetical protein OK074_8232 [Actinobacteria bacterium OK074]|nr:hypothetical protein OK074_8232 [Actinobacteria bacterium OK074]